MKIGSGAMLAKVDLPIPCLPYSNVRRGACRRPLVIWSSSGIRCSLWLVCVNGFHGERVVAELAGQKAHEEPVQVLSDLAVAADHDEPLFSTGAVAGPQADFGFA